MWKKISNNQAVLENLIYLIVWLIIFITPVFNVKEEIGRDWEVIFRIWKTICPFFIFFLINNYLLLPHLFFKKKIWSYIIIILLTVISLFIFNPFDIMGKEREKMREIERTIMPPPPRGEFNLSPLNKKHGPPFLFHPQNSWIMIFIIIGLNIAIKLLFKSIRDEKQLRELEKYSLETELNYLKAQINPHFFMNTLNNIHALIDIDSEKAKETVIDLSKMMRYVLYDANQKQISLSKEIEFLKNYIELMKIRYTDKLDLTFSLPETLPDVNLPPLLFLSFIENAFKHGVSYRQLSFIHLQIEINKDNLSFSLQNSNFKNEETSTSGVGLENISKRLNLLYNNNYSLHLEEKEYRYHVLLIIPLY